MQRRSVRGLVASLSVFAATFLASCSNDVGTTGPRIAALSIASGNNQVGPIGGILAQPLVVSIKDQRGDPVEGVIVVWTVSAGDGIVTPGVDTTDADGLARTTFRLGSSLGVQTVSAGLSDLQPVSFSATATAAPANRLTVTAGDGQTGTVGSVLSTDIQVRVTDAFDNVKAGIPVTFAVGSGGGAVSSTSVLSDATGIATVKWTLGPISGTQSLTVGAGSLTPATITATARPGAAAGIVVVQGNNQQGLPGAALPDSVIIRVVDQFGNGISGDSVTWTLSAAGGTVSPSVTFTGPGGRTATKWTLGLSGGPKKLTAKSGAATIDLTGAAFITFASVTAGGRSACGIDDGGVLYCWGFNGDGQLGIGQGPLGAGPVYALPQAAAPVGNQTFGQVNGGSFANCGVTFSHVGYCWGDNNNGQTGTGIFSRSVTEPTPISVGVAFSTISAGRVHSCGLSVGGVPYCWGSNERGQLGGNVTIDTVAHTVLLVPSNAPKLVGSTTDGKFFGTYDFRAISAGGIHTCAVDFQHQALCWGMGRDGQLGDGTNSVDEYIPQFVVGGAVFDSITAGFSHSCAILTDGSAQCWGLNSDGQLGTGTFARQNIPTTVAGGLTFMAISAGLGHTCALATDGTAYCWGNNSKGQLGDGTMTTQSNPVAVAGGLTFKTISAGDYQTCGVTTDDVAYCWGDNEFGSIGDGTLTVRLEPTKVAFQR
ncbi:MAG: hypothetical protein ABI647_07410 [Gemmatimonadota bacterium]